MQQNPRCSGAAPLFRGVEALAGPVTFMPIIMDLAMLCCIGSSSNPSHFVILFLLLYTELVVAVVASIF